MNKQIRLYDTQPTLTECDAVVVECLPVEDGFSVLTDKTCFFPEGGGQAADRGCINDFPVLSVSEKVGNVLLTVNSAFPVGSKVHLRIDRQKRLDDIEVHTGEHMLSGLALSLFGAKNVGFHIGEEASTADLSIFLSTEQIATLENAVNQAIRENHPVRVLYPTPEELSGLGLRKIPAKEESLRAVIIDGVDACGCCGTHTSYTGQVGVCLILSAEKWKGGTRVTFLCGRKAWSYIQKAQAELKAVAGVFSSQPLAALSRVKALEEERKNLRREISQLKKQLGKSEGERLVSLKQAEISNETNVAQEKHIVASLSTGDMEMLREAALVIASYPGYSATLTGEGIYCLSKADDSLFELSEENNRLALSGARGGGRGNLFSGILPGKEKV